MFKVKKNNGSLEDFDRNHVVGSVMKAGGLAEEAEKVAVGVEAWLPTAVVEGSVNSSQIRAKVIEVLRPINPTAADSFELYKKEPSVA